MTTENHIIIGNISPRIQYTADGQQREFIYSFPIFEDSDLEVFIGDERQERGFTLTGAGENQGGTLTFTSPPPAQAVVTLRRHVPVQRTTDFQEGGAFRAKVINDELDRMTAQIQQIEVEASRSLKLSTSDTGEKLILPSSETRNGKLLGFDSRGRPVAEVAPGEIQAADQRARDAEIARQGAEAARNQADTDRQAAQAARSGAEAAQRAAESATQTARRELATKDEAETGTNNAKLMTPLRTKEAIETLGGGSGRHLKKTRFMSSGDITIPPGISKIVVTLAGAGGGGGTFGTGRGGQGGSSTFGFYVNSTKKQTLVAHGGLGGYDSRNVTTASYRRASMNHSGPGIHDKTALAAARLSEVKTVDYFYIFGAGGSGGVGETSTVSQTYGVGGNGFNGGFLIIEYDISTLPQSKRKCFFAIGSSGRGGSNKSGNGAFGYGILEWME